MIGVAVCVLIVLLVVWIGSLECESILAGLIYGAAATVVLWAFYSFFAWGYYSEPSGIRGAVSEDAHKVSSSRLNLKALGTDSQVSGAFFLGSGYVDENLMFNYIIQDTQNPDAYRLESVIASTILVIEDAPQGTGYIETTKYMREDNNLWLYNLHNVTQTREEFHIPEGSIKDGYVVDVTNE